MERGHLRARQGQIQGVYSANDGMAGGIITALKPPGIKRPGRRPGRRARGSAADPQGRPGLPLNSVASDRWPPPFARRSSDQPVDAAFGLELLEQTGHVARRARVVFVAAAARRGFIEARDRNDTDPIVLAVEGDLQELLLRSLLLELDLVASELDGLLRRAGRGARG